MSPKNLTNVLFKRHPEVQELSAKHLKLVRILIEEAAVIASRDVLTHEGTEKAFRAIVPDMVEPGF